MEGQQDKLMRLETEQESKSESSWATALKKYDPLEEIFQKDGLNWVKIPRVTYSGDNRWYENNNIFISSFGCTDKKLYAFLNGDKFVESDGTRVPDAYIRVTDSVYEKMKKRLHLQGPGSDSLHQCLNIYCHPGGTARVLLKGWGLAFIEIWEGPTEELLEFFKNNEDPEVKSY